MQQLIRVDSTSTRGEQKPVLGLVDELLEEGLLSRDQVLAFSKGPDGSFRGILAFAPKLKSEKSPLLLGPLI